MRLAAAMNLAKAWLLVLLLAGLFAGVGWLAGGYRAASLFGFCALLAAAAVYAYADRALLGMLGRTRVRARGGPDPALERRRAVREAPDRSAEALPHRRRLPASVRGRPRAAGLLDRRQHGPARRAAAGRARGAFSPTSSRTCARATCWCRRSPSCSPSCSSRRRASVAGSDARCSRFSAPSRPRSSTCCSRRGASSPPIARRRSCAGRRTVSPTHSRRLDRASELVSFSESVVTEPLYTVNPFADEGLAALFGTHPPVGERVARLRRLDPTWQANLHAA